MRKVIVVLLIMLSAAIVSSGQPPDRFPPILATPAQAGGLMILQGGVPVVEAGVKYCPSDSCTPSGCVTCEGFGASTDNCTWAAGNNADTSVTISLTGQSTSGLTNTGWCTDSGGYAAKVVKTTGDYGSGTSSYVTWSSGNTVYAQFYFYLAAAVLVDDETPVQIISMSEDTYHGTYGTISLRIKKTGGAYYLEFKVKDVVVHTYPAISVGQWYGIRMSYTNNTSASFALDNDNDGDFADDTHTETTEKDDAVINRFNFYTCTSTTSQTFTFYVANLKVSTTDYPGDCTR